MLYDSICMKFKNKQTGFMVVEIEKVVTWLV